jgi:hypothetical protein
MVSQHRRPQVEGEAKINQQWAERERERERESSIAAVKTPLKQNTWSFMLGVLLHAGNPSV